MIGVTGRIALCGWIAVGLPGAASHASLATEPVPVPPAAGQAEEPAEPEPPLRLPLVSGRFVDERGKGVGDAWLTVAAATDATVKVRASVDEFGNFAILRLPPADGDLWTLGDFGAAGHLPVAVSIERLDEDGLPAGEPERVDYVPGVSLPEFALPVGAGVRIRLIMGDKKEVATRWAEARRRDREARQREEPPRGETPTGGEASAAWAAGNEKFGEGDYAGALADYDAALEQAPDEPRLLSARASALYYLGRLEESREAAEAALRAGSGDLQLLLALADRFIKTGDARNAGEILAALSKAAPDNPDVHLQRARLSRHEGDTAAAAAAYREATRRAPQIPKLWSEMATFCRENGEQDCARDAYTALVRLDPAFDRTALYFLGTLSEGPQAIAYFEKATSYVPEAHIKLCVAYRQAGETDKAIAACRRYLELVPSGAQADQVKALLAALEQAD